MNSSPPRCTVKAHHGDKTVLPVTVERLTKLLQAQNIQTELESGKDCDIIRFRLGDSTVRLMVYCGKQPPTAESIRFYTGWTIPPDKHDAVVQACNNWNGDSRFTRAWAEPGRTALEADILCWDGMSDIYFRSVLTLLQAMTVSFMGEIQSVLKSAG